LGGEQPARSALAKIKEGPGGAGRQVEPSRHADRVLAGKDLCRKLRVTAGTRQLERAAESRIVHEDGAVAAQRGVGVIPGRVLGIRGEEITGHKRRLSNPVEELIAPLGGDGPGAGGHQQHSRQDDTKGSAQVAHADVFHGRTSYQE
jgi:hypothetical protein